ncbi:MAG: hypothetical protein R2807_00660 [Chitinophagales bacterium]
MAGLLLFAHHFGPVPQKILRKGIADETSFRKAIYTAIDGVIIGIIMCVFESLVKRMYCMMKNLISNLF